MDLPGFDEQLYLIANPDVKAAVERGECASGLAHYLAYGHIELRRGAPLLPDEPGLASHIPPKHLRIRVHGAQDVASFQEVGKAVAANIRDIASSRGSLTNFSNILDFGCGCGRIITALREISSGRLFGTDIDGEAINWCRENLGSIASFQTNDFNPPLSFGDNTFDLIYSISIFTHLPEDMQSAWLSELNRVLSPGGYALLTVHGSSLFPHDLLGPDAIETFERSGFWYVVGAGTEGLPEFYQTSFTTENYVKTKWAEFLNVKEILPRAAGGYQDMIVCRKKI